VLHIFAFRNDLKSLKKLTRKGEKYATQTIEKEAQKGSSKN